MFHVGQCPVFRVVLTSTWCLRNDGWIACGLDSINFINQSRGLHQNASDLLNLRDFKFSSLNTINIFQCTGKIYFFIIWNNTFEFPRQISYQYIEGNDFIQLWILLSPRFKRPCVFLKSPQSREHMIRARYLGIISIESKHRYTDKKLGFVFVDMSSLFPFS